MAEFPYLPLFTDAYLGDTMHLTTREHGAYLLLLITAWRSKDGTLPDDDEILSRYVRMTAAAWRKMRPIMVQFFKIEDGVWKNPRLLDERTSVDRIQQQRISAGKASALKRLNRGSTAVQRTFNGRSTPTPTLIKEKKKESYDSSKESWGTRVPEDFWPNETSMAKAEKLGVPVTPDLIASFLDYWRSVPGTKGRKSDWQATFRNNLDYVATHRGKTTNGRDNTIRGGFDQIKEYFAERDSREEIRAGGSTENVLALPGLRKGPS